MIPVEHRRGLYLPEADLWLDPPKAKDFAFVSHAHADHFARHQLALCSEVTASLVRARYRVAEARLRPIPFHGSIEHRGHRLRLLPAGHIRGSAMLHVTRLEDGATLLYTGDFKVRKSRTAEPVAFQQADLLVLETTFALPHFVFPPPLEVEAAVLRFVHNCFDDGDVPVLLGYSLGKAQEALALLHEHGIAARLHPAVAEMTAACRATGLGNLPEPELLESSPCPPGTAVIAPPSAVRTKLLSGIANRRTAMLSGWALMPGATFRYRVDEAIPLSDHADHPGLLELVQRIRPRKVLTVHGYAREFAAELRHKGIEAWSALGGDQLELPIAAAGSSGKVVAPRASASPRHTRPICPLADFTDLCRLVGETQSRLGKIAHLSKYLAALGGTDPAADDLARAATWLTGRALPRRAGVLRTGTAALRRALLHLPGAREERYREISLTQNDAARTARLVLQELHLEPLPLDLPGLGGFFESLAGTSGSLARIELLAGRLRTLHPAEGETVVRLLTGDLRIGLKEGLLEEAVARAFDADPEQVRSAHMLTGDLGETARLAREQRLETAGLHPFVPVKVMLASPEPTAEDLLQRHAPASAGDRSALWLEPKFDGIRAQLHKQGDRAALFSRDLRPLDREFPELLQAALRIPGDFILDGEIIAYAEGRRLTFFDLQKRLGRLNPYQGDLFTAGPAAAEPGRPGFEVPPVRLVAFDLLLKDGSTLLDSPLADRRRALEDLLSLAHPHPAPVISPIPVIRCGTLDGIESSFKQARADGHEGLISKDAASPYTPGRRGKAWLKLKGVMPTLDCVVVAAQQGHGRRAEVLSDYTFAVRDADNGELRVIGKAYSGLTDREIEDLTDHFQRHTLEKQHRKHLVEPNLVLEIAFDAIRPSKRHDSGLALRFPRIKAIRRDKTPADIDTLQYARSLL